MCARLNLRPPRPGQHPELATTKSRKGRNATAHSLPASPVVASRGSRRRGPHPRRLLRRRRRRRRQHRRRRRRRLLAHGRRRRMTPTTTTRRLADEYTEETGVEVEVIPYPSDAYNTQVTTQLQAGNAADVMVLSPGTGQADLGHHPRRSGLPRAARRHLRRPHPRGHRGALPGRRRDLRPADGSLACRHDLQRRRRRRGRHRRVPRRPTTTSSRRARPRATAARPSPSSPAASRSTRACSRMLISATRVYAGDPRLERAARGGRRHLRRQRLAGDGSRTSSS